jgi:hypothetical protein
LDAKSNKSGVSQGGISGAGEEAKSEAAENQEEGEKDFSVEPTYTEKGWFSRANIQNFLFSYIGEKLRSQNMSLMVGHGYLKFISELPQPMELNQTRKNMKEEAYKTLRTILRTPEKFGDAVLGNFAADAEKIGISANVFNTVWEGFWDLYYKRPVADTGLNTKKFEGWINNIALSVPKYGAPVPDPADGEEAQEPLVAPDVKAVVRIRIPFEEPEPKDPDAEPVDDGAKSQRSRRSGASRRSKVPSEPVKKLIEPEDRVLAVPSIIDGMDY